MAFVFAQPKINTAAECECVGLKTQNRGKTSRNDHFFQRVLGIEEVSGVHPGDAISTVAATPIEACAAPLVNLLTISVLSILSWVKRLCHHQAVKSRVGGDGGGADLESEIFIRDSCTPCRLQR